MKLSAIRNDKSALDILVSDVSQCLSVLWGENIYGAYYEALSKRISCVGRLHIKGSNNKTVSVIVKHLPIDCYPAQTVTDVSQELREEQVCYQFLQSTRDSFPLFAQMYAFDDRGFMILEDLSGSEKEEEEELDVLASRLGYTFAALHLATFKKVDIYNNMRKAAGLPAPMNDPRAYSLAAHRRRYQLGAATVKDYCNILNVALPDTYNQHIDLIEAEMENPGIFHCFIHDDLANARQVINRDAQFHLIDFENAKCSHALLDLCKPLAGKFEMLLEDGEFFYANPNFPDSFIDEYRKSLYTLGRKHFDQQYWDFSLTQALLYHCLALIGKLIEISSDRQLRKDFSFDLFNIISRHVYLLNKLETFTPIKGVLSQLLQSIQNPEINESP
ncbi:hypothetical protein A9Q81_12970 [Gammaproteobacteria bacterium 42_54_T18]|nr:hypothetical protein A9Q81_12970 [Gammaproteobacteria bacterium 42_54_T18]